MNIDTIQNLLSDSKIKTFQPNEIIFNEGEEDSNFYFIVEGNVEISKKTHGGQTKVIAELEKGDFLGEGILSGSVKKPASAKAVNTLKLLILTSEKFQTLIKDHPAKIVEFLLRVLESTNERLTSTNEKLLSIYEINQIINTYKNDLKSLANHITDRLVLMTDSDQAVFLIKNPFSNDYRSIHTLSQQFSWQQIDSNLLRQTQKIQLNNEHVLILALEEVGSIIMTKKNKYEEDQIRTLVLIAEQIASAIKEVSEKEEDKAKQMLHSKHFEI